MDRGLIAGANLEQYYLSGSETCDIHKMQQQLASDTLALVFQVNR